MRAQFLALFLVAEIATFAVAQQPVAVSASVFSDLKVYPNPWHANQKLSTDIHFAPLPNNALIQIFTLSGRLVKKLSASSNEALWDCTNDSGDAVASGVYLFVVHDGQGNKSTGKIAVIR